MKRKVAITQLILLILFAGLSIFGYFRNQVRSILWEGILNEDYDLEVIEIYGSFDIPLDQALRYELPGFDATMLFRFAEAPRDYEPAQGVMVNYVLTNDGEKLIYSYPYLYRKQKPKDFVYVVDDPQDLTIDEILEVLSEKPEYQEVANEILSRNFGMVHSYETSLHHASSLFRDFMKDHLQGILFFELVNEDGVFFSFNDEVYVMIKQNNDYIFILPEVLTFDQFMQRVIGI